MSMISCQDVRQVLSDLLAGVAEPAEAEALDVHLAGCVSCRTEASNYLRIHRALDEMAVGERIGEIQSSIRALLGEAEHTRAAAAAIGEPRCVSARVRHSARRPWWVVGMAVAILLASGVAWWAWHPEPTPVIARLEQVQGEVFVLVGDARVPAKEHQAIYSGRGLQTVGESSTAVIVYPDSTRVEIGPDSTIGELRDSKAKDHTKPSKRVSLVEGSVSVDVPKQEDGQPMVFVTPQAEIALQDTKVNLVNSPQATRVDPERGSVRLTRLSDGRSLEIAAGSYSIAHVAQVAEGLQARPLPAQFSKARRSLPVLPGTNWTLAFSPDGRTLATGAKEGKVQLWDMALADDQMATVLDAFPRDLVRFLAFSRDGRQLAAGSDDHFLVRLWNMEDRKETSTLQGHRTWIEALAFSGDGRTLVVAGAHGQESAQIHIWDLDRRQSIAKLDGHQGGVWTAVISPDGQTLATSGRDGVIKLWDLATHQLLRAIQAHGSEIFCLAYSPDGKTLVSSSKDKTVKLWDVAELREKHTMLGHAQEIRGVAFAPDGQTVASASSDGTVRLWNVADGRELATFRHPGGVFCVAFAPDGKSLAAGGSFGSVKLWDLPR
jgi:WD40 repeat protein